MTVSLYIIIPSYDDDDSCDDDDDDSCDDSDDDEAELDSPILDLEAHEVIDWDEFLDE